MSISSALSNALSGLTANSKAAHVVSANLANVQTPGYARREIALSSRADAAGGGVMIEGITRHVNPGLLADRRLADSDVAYAETRAGFLSELERLTGTPGEPGSLSDRFAKFESALVTAAAKPEEETRLRATVIEAGRLTDALGTLSRKIQNLRSDAETKIEKAVTDTNSYLEQIHTLNKRIVKAANTGRPTAAFEDQRQMVIDHLAEVMPLRLARRDSGAVAVYTPGGATLLDMKPATLSFTASTVVTTGMTVDNGLLDGLRINGVDVAPSGDWSPIKGGKLAAFFELRDDLATDAQTQLDAIARDLIMRFQAAGLDSSRGPGEAGLFTDAGAAFDVADETGVAGRIAVNDRVDAEAGGAYWRLRDGLGTTAPGPAGDAALLHTLSDTLESKSALASGDLGVTARSAGGHVSAMLSRFGHQRLSLDQEVSFATAQQRELVESELSMGVDSDAEMQKLLLIEQAYSANARMVKTVDEMLDALLRI